MNKKRLVLILGALPVIALLLFACYAWLTLHWSYSQGQRAGYVQKFSKRGWLCKTWEGELLLTTLPGVVPEKFEFTVSNEAVAAQINANMGKRMVLAYDQHKGVPGSCFGDTEYFIESVIVSN
ncbi:MAG TPA: hypothetical protein VF472_20960 [Burkholderiaceae bacterium]